MTTFISGVPLLVKQHSFSHPLLNSMRQKNLIRFQIIPGNLIRLYFFNKCCQNCMAAAEALLSLLSPHKCSCCRNDQDQA